MNDRRCHAHEARDAPKSIFVIRSFFIRSHSIVKVARFKKKLFEITLFVSTSTVIFCLFCGKLKNIVKKSDVTWHFVCVAAFDFHFIYFKNPLKLSKYTRLFIRQSNKPKVANMKPSGGGGDEYVSTIIFCVSTLWGFVKYFVVS